MIEGHLHRLRSSPVYKEARIYVFVEANYGGDWGVDQVRRIVEQTRFSPIKVVKYDETTRDRPGVWMTEKTKQCMMHDMQRSLADGYLCFAQDFITTRSVERQGQMDIRKELMTQFMHYREEVVRAKNKDEAIADTKIIITGKSSGGRKDDLCITCQIALYFSGQYRLEPSFITLASQFNWRY